MIRGETKPGCPRGDRKPANGSGRVNGNDQMNLYENDGSGIAINLTLSTLMIVINLASFQADNIFQGCQPCPHVVYCFTLTSDSHACSLLFHIELDVAWVVETMAQP